MCRLADLIFKKLVDFAPAPTPTKTQGGFSDLKNILNHVCIGNSSQKVLTRMDFDPCMFFFLNWKH